MAQQNSRDEAIAVIRAALKRRSGKSWSVTGGRGTAWGWIKIDAPPARKTWSFVLPEGARDEPENYIEVQTGAKSGHMSPAERKELAALLGGVRVDHQGESIPASSDYYREYMDRAEGREPSTVGVQYWD